MKSPFLIAALLAAVCCMFEDNKVQAQATTSVFHTYVGRYGSDSGTCGTDINSPCRTMSYAVGRTSAGGEIECVETLDQLSGNVVISKSLTLSCDGGRWSNASGSRGSINLGLTVTLAADEIVTLRGIRLLGARTGSEDGLLFNGSGTLVLDNVQITDWTGNGVLFQPNGSGKLVVSNSLIAANGNFSSKIGAGIRVVPQAGGTAQVSISRTDFGRNVFGVAVDGSGSTGGINATISDCVMASNANDGVVATSSSSTAPVAVSVINSKTLNNGFGVRSIGSNVTVRLDGSKIIGNGVGLGGGGALLSAGNNLVQANATAGSFTGPVPLQ